MLEPLGHRLVGDRQNFRTDKTGGLCNPRSQILIASCKPLILTVPLILGRLEERISTDPLCDQIGLYIVIQAGSELLRGTPQGPCKPLKNLDAGLELRQGCRPSFIVGKETREVPCIWNCDFRTLWIAHVEYLSDENTRFKTVGRNSIPLTPAP